MSRDVERGSEGVLRMKRAASCNDQDTYAWIRQEGWAHVRVGWNVGSMQLGIRLGMYAVFSSVWWCCSMLYTGLQTHHTDQPPRTAQFLCITFSYVMQDRVVSTRLSTYIPANNTQSHRQTCSSFCMFKKLRPCRDRAPMRWRLPACLPDT
eukprot:COSAG02_NODE_8920_length_2400_cov_1.365928_3_plen_151_part_00